MNIADSATKTDYARVPGATATTRRSFAPTLWPTFAALVCITLFTAAGQWQWDKAVAKREKQTLQDQRVSEAPLTLPATVVDRESLLSRRVLARGVYEPQYQILIDNRTHAGQAGYHLITPLRLEGSATRVLVNRGWLPLPANRGIPPLATPDGVVEVSGVAAAPAPFFALGKEQESAAWQTLWQHLDLDRYAKVVNFPLQTIVIELDAASPAGGFVRAWQRPDARITTNLAYALQWWAFAATTAGLWLFFTFRRDEAA